jgi:hypothetical protein
VINPQFGTAEVLTEAEQMDLYACEEVIASGWQTFVQVGLALARIPDARLYRVEFVCFEDYCQAKWLYGRRYVNRLISAAQVFTSVGTISSLRKPEHETQVRPLVGLTPEQAQLAWARAIEKAGGRRITAALVKSAMHDLHFHPPPNPINRQARRTKAEPRQLIESAIGELLVLLSQKVSHAILAEKVEMLHAYFQALLSAPASKKPRSPQP